MGPLTLTSSSFDVNHDAPGQWFTNRCEPGTCARSHATCCIERHGAQDIVAISYTGLLSDVLGCSMLHWVAAGCRVLYSQPFVAESSADVAEATRRCACFIKL